MKQFLLSFLIALSVLVSAQDKVIIKSKAATMTEQSATKTSKLTSYTYKGLKVWQSINNKYYVIRKSKNGKIYKEYVELIKVEQ